MPCFLGCFGGGRKNRRRQNQLETNKEESVVESIEPNHVNDRIITEISDKVEEKISQSPTKKRVTFDSQIKTYDHILLQEFVEEKEEETKTKEGSMYSSNTGKSSSEDSLVASNSLGTNPSIHRYKNSRESDDEVEEEEDELDSDLEEDEDYYSDDDGFDEDKLHNPIKEAYSEEIDAKLKSSNESIRDGNHLVHGVLNPVENLTQWKSAKSKGRTIHKQSQKENSNLISNQEDKRDSSSLGADPPVNDTTLSYKPKKPRDEDLIVDASLSTWLSTSETGSECNSVSITPVKNKSSCYSKRGVRSSHDDRPILCALTLEDIKEFSATSTPRKSPSKSPDETPVIGTVGGYWSSRSKATEYGSASSFKGIPNTTSKYREDKSVNWHSTPFEARLEKALNKTDT